MSNTNNYNYSNIPEKLRQLKQWVVHRGKKPFNPHTGVMAKSNDPESWVTFDEAVQAVKTKGYDGIGFMFSKDSGLLVIDLDTVYDPKTGTMDEVARNIIISVNSYTEFSQSGYGFHIIAYARNINLNWHRKKLGDNGIQRLDIDKATGEVKTTADGRPLYKMPEIEMYTSSQYVILTGSVYEEHNTIHDATVAVTEIQAQFSDNNCAMTTTKKQTKLLLNNDAVAVSKDTSDPMADDNFPLSSEARDVFTAAIFAKNHEKFLNLYQKELNDSHDWSSSDMSLCCILAHFTKDPHIIDEIFRTSKLMRPKWDELHGNSTYGAHTIHKAIDFILSREQTVVKSTTQKVVAQSQETVIPVSSSSQVTATRETVTTQTPESAGVSTAQMDKPREAPPAQTVQSQEALSCPLTASQEIRSPQQIVAVEVAPKKLPPEKVEAVVSISSQKTVQVSEQYHPIDLQRRISNIIALKRLPLPTENLDAATLFGVLFGSVCKFVCETGEWLYYNGTKWEKNEFKVRSLLQDIAYAIDGLANSITDDISKGVAHECAKKWKNNRFRQAILKDAETLPECAIRYDELNHNPYLFNVQNGTINLCDGTFQNHNPEDYITYCADVIYDPDAHSEKWDKFLHQIFDDNEEQITFVQSILGYMLYGKAPEECFFLFKGVTRAGKGTLISTVQKAMGDYVKILSADALASTKQLNPDKPTESFARLASARMVIVHEPDQRLRLNSSLIKTITGNDTLVARFLYGHFVEFTPDFKLVIVSNHYPRIDDKSIFDSDRLQLVNFNHHFNKNEQDKSLKSTLTSPKELSAVLNFMLAGWFQYKKNGLVVPESNQKNVRQLQEDNDRIGSFINDELEYNESTDLKAMAVYHQYEVWCKDRNYYADNYQLFLQQLDSRGLVRRNTRIRGNGRAGSPTTIIRNYCFRRNTQSNQTA
ncbi:phage/plasmid primase, P4 family [Agathobaculum sp. Marseille-P7918]|uniref:phage/plasmid primase, P4 family n=1 Tax=Agathobaculum sp. Marseille-P7918 TaxID=2479843 RepID=UPI00356918DB